MHIIDVGGMGADIGFLGISSSMARMRGKALGLAQALSGSRFLRSFIMPGGVHKVEDTRLKTIRANARELRKDLEPITSIFLESQPARERMEVAGISRSLASEFGLVGVAARACGIEYDCRRHFRCAAYPEYAPPASVESKGDIFARERVRIQEIWSSLDVIERVLAELPAGALCVDMPKNLPENSIATGIVEAFRGELIHLVFTDDKGGIKRYAIKDPSFNNWTAISIAIRNGLIADFPLCNKSFGLSYSGNDL